MKGRETPMTTTPVSLTYTLDAPATDGVPLDVAAQLLGVTESRVREWLSTFHWERHFDGSGHLRLSPRDLTFLRLVQSLRAVDRSCDSITRLLAPHVADEARELPPASELSQIASLKAALRELQPAPVAPPFWKFWATR